MHPDILQLTFFSSCLQFFMSRVFLPSLTKPILQNLSQLKRVFSLDVFSLFTSSVKTNSVKYLLKPNTLLSTLLDLCESVQPDLDIPSHSRCIEQDPETNRSHNKAESTENRTQEKTSKSDHQKLHFMSYPWILWLGEKNEKKKKISNADIDMILGRFTTVTRQAQINNTKHECRVISQQATSGLHYPLQTNQPIFNHQQDT